MASQKKDAKRSSRQVIFFLRVSNPFRSFKIEIGLSPGYYQYKFIVDGIWRYDPEEPTIEDGKGGYNNIVDLKPLNLDEDEEEEDSYYIFIQNPDGHIKVKNKKVTYQYPAIWVAIKGSWDGWKNEILLKKMKNNFTGFMEYYVNLKIAPGEYEFKFYVDGHWVTNPNYPTTRNKEGIENNYLIVSKEQAPENDPHAELVIKDSDILNWRREEGKWTECSGIHHTLQGHSISNICELIYIFGGLANNKFTNTLYIYDPKSNEFSVVEDQKGDIPEPRAFHQ